MRRVITELKKKKDYYERIRKSAEVALKDTKEAGTIRVVNSRGRDSYYLCTEKGDTKGRYLKKHELSLAQAMIQRDYNRKVLKCANDWLKWIDHTLKAMPLETLPQIFEKSKRRKTLIIPYELSDEEYRKWWESVEYKGKEFKAGTVGIYTEKGEQVRSKTEKMIADKLYMLNIPYRYEYPIEINPGRCIYPDFLLLNVQERKEYIWEHFGMMDNPEYAEKAVRKIQNYTRNRYHAGDNIIYTFETSRAPVDMLGINRILEQLGMVNGVNR